MERRFETLLSLQPQRRPLTAPRNKLTSMRADRGLSLLVRRSKHHRPALVHAGPEKSNSEAPLLPGHRTKPHEKSTSPSHSFLFLSQTKTPSGAYPDIKFVSESVYLQVEPSS